MDNQTEYQTFQQASESILKQTQQPSAALQKQSKTQSKDVQNMKPKFWKTNEETQQLGILIREYYDVFNTYGKSTSSIANIVKYYSMALEDYTIETIKKAFLERLKSNNVFPTPSDIIHIIENNVEWNPEAIKDLREKKRNGVQLTSYEENYHNEASSTNRPKYAPKPRSEQDSGFYFMDYYQQLNASSINRKIFSMFEKNLFYKTYVQGGHANLTDLGDSELRLSIRGEFSRDMFLESYGGIIGKAGYIIKEVIIRS